MLGFSPSQYYYYMWKYVSPFVLTCLLVASIVQMGLSPPGYNAWIEDTVCIQYVCVYVGFVCVKKNTSPAFYKAGFIGDARFVLQAVATTFGINDYIS